MVKRMYNRRFRGAYGISAAPDLFLHYDPYLSTTPRITGIIQAKAGHLLMGIEPLQGSPAAAPVISSRTEVSLSAPGVIAHCSCHTAFSDWMLIARRITSMSSRILWSCSRGSADPGTKVPDECVFSCQCSPKRFLSSPIGLFFGKNEP